MKVARENHVFVGDLILSNCIYLCLLPPPLPDQKSPTGINKSQNTDDGERERETAVYDADCVEWDFTFSLFFSPSTSLKQLFLHGHEKLKENRCKRNQKP